jgi:hypothetical protein
MHYISDMADVVRSGIQDARHHIARTRRRRVDLWIGSTALIAAMLALPLAQSSWHGPEVASVLAVAATALLAGQRWAISVIALAELLLVPTVASAAFGGGFALWPGRIAALLALLAIAPGLLALRRAAAALVIVTGRPRDRATCRKFHIALVAFGVLAVIAPLL